MSVKPPKKPSSPIKTSPPDCIICHHPTINRRHYCERCRPLVQSHHMDKLKRRAALIAAIDRLLDAFLCQYARRPVELVDRTSHKLIQFDHITPNKTSALQVLWAVFNQMKTDLSDEEFRIIVRLLRDHWLGDPFDKEAVKFHYWSRKKLKLSSPMRAAGPVEDLRQGETPTDDCIICGDKAYPNSVYCPRCRKFFRWAKESLARRKALKEAWDPVRRKFICFYTGVELDENDINSPWYVSFDLGIPGKLGDRRSPDLPQGFLRTNGKGVKRPEGDMVVAALWVSVMKVDLARDEFYAVIKELARCFETGDNFDERVCAFLYWKRREDGTRKLKIFPLV